MKKLSGLWLLLAACIFASGLIGYYVGRNSGRASVDISTIKSHANAASTDAVADTATLPTEFTGPVNINTADCVQLQTLPGIGPSLAQRIVDYRTQYGPFSSVYDLMNVSGIGLAKLESILDYITLGGEE